MHVAVELNGKLTRGITVCEYYHKKQTSDCLIGVSPINSGEPPNCEVEIGINKNKFYDLLIDTISYY